jgi:metal-responsive CopG/Arc/MetJ family transcriptional regulator
MAKEMKAFRCDQILLGELDAYSRSINETDSNIIRLALYHYLASEKRKERQMGY